MPPRLPLHKPHSFPAPGTPARPCMSPHVVMTSTRAQACRQPHLARAKMFGQATKHTTAARRHTPASSRRSILPAASPALAPRRGPAPRLTAAAAGEAALPAVLAGRPAGAAAAEEAQVARLYLCPTETAYMSPSCKSFASLLKQ